MISLLKQVHRIQKYSSSLKRSSRIYNNEEEEASSLEGSDHLKQGNVFIMNNVCNIARTYPISDRVKKCTLILSLTRTSFEPHSRLIRCIRIHLKVACLDSIFLSISKINNRPMQFFRYIESYCS